MDVKTMREIGYKLSLKMARDIREERPHISEADALKSAAHWSGIELVGRYPDFLEYVEKHRHEI
jgi:hypothetical protein